MKGLILGQPCSFDGSRVQSRPLGVLPNSRSKTTPREYLPDLQGHAIVYESSTLSHLRPPGVRVPHLCCLRCVHHPAYLYFHRPDHRHVSQPNTRHRGTIFVRRRHRVQYLCRSPLDKITRNSRHSERQTYCKATLGVSQRVSTMPSSTPAPRSPARPHAGAALSFPSTSASSSFLSRPGRHISGRQINNLTRTTNKTPSRSASQSNFLARVATPAYGLNTPSANGRRSRAASSIGGSEGHQIICAVSEARGVVPSVGIALINVSTGEAVLSQICDNQSYVKTTQKLTVFEPSKVLIISSACPPSPKSSLCATIEEELPGVPIVPLDRKYWSETAGLELIQALAFKEDVEAIKVAIQGNYYATSAFSAVCFLVIRTVLAWYLFTDFSRP